MSLRTLAVLSWIGLLAGALVWAGQHVVGFGISHAKCGGADFGISIDVWQGALMGAAVLSIAAAEAAAIAAYVGTGDTSYEADPPASRIRFFAIAAIPANLIFLMIVLLDGFASIFARGCVGG
jgi:hypothetical protein